MPRHASQQVQAEILLKIRKKHSSNIKWLQKQIHKSGINFMLGTICNFNCRCLVLIFSTVTHVTTRKLFDGPWTNYFFFYKLRKTGWNAKQEQCTVFIYYMKCVLCQDLNGNVFIYFVNRALKYVNMQLLAVLGQPFQALMCKDLACFAHILPNQC